jgi:predicted MFS family arabinose efflux permease
MLVVAAAYLMTHIGPEGSGLALGLLVAAAILIDFGVTANMTFGQRMIFSLGAELRGRLNGLYVAAFFTGCAVGSAIGGWSYAQGGWTLCAWVGLVPPLAALVYFLTE